MSAVAMATSSRPIVASLFGPAREPTKATLGAVALAGIVLTGVAAAQGLLAGLLALGAVVIGIQVLRYPSFGALLLVAAVPVLSGIRRGFPIPGLRISEVLVVMLGGLVLLTIGRREAQPWMPVDWLFLAYASGSVLFPLAHLIARNEAVGIGSLASTFLPLQFFLFYRAVRSGLATDVQRRVALRLLLYGSIVVSALAAVQQLDIGPARVLMQQLTASDALSSYSYEVYARATGPFQHWHPLAGYLTVILLVCVALLLDDDQRVMARRMLIAVLAINLAALMLSVTFVSMFGVLAGSILLGLWAGRLRKALKWSAIGGVVAMLLFGSFVITRVQNQYADGTGGRRDSIVPQTVENRVNVWRDQYIPGLSGRWASGYGPDLPPDVRWAHTESLYVTVLLRGGIPLLALFAFSMAALSKEASKAARDIARRPAARAVVVLIAVLWVMHLLFPYMTASGLPQPFWGLAGIVLASWQSREMQAQVRS